MFYSILCSPLRTRLHSHFVHDRARAAFSGMSRALIEKIIVFDDKIRIFFKYTKTSPEVNPWEMPAYPGSDSSDMVDLRRVELRSYKVHLRTLHA